MNTEIKKDDVDVTNDKNKGLPKVADMEVYRTPLMAVVVIAIAILVVGFGVYKGKSVDTQKVDEESYTISALPVAEKQVEMIQPAEQVAETKQPEVSPEELQQKMMLLQEKQKEIQQRLAAPLMVVNNSQSAPSPGASQGTNPFQMMLIPNSCSKCLVKVWMSLKR